MRILFATDLTEPVRVTKTVEDLVRRLDAELLVLHIIAPAPAPSVTPVDPMTGLSGFAPYSLYDPQVEADMEQAEQHAFRSFLTERFTLPIRPAVRKGEAAQVIIEDADEHDVDLVIVGKRRHGRLEQFFVGSTATDVLKHADRPILILPVRDDES